MLSLLWFELKWNFKNCRTLKVKLARSLYDVISFIKDPFIRLQIRLYDVK